ncbi:MAG: hypothetical protein K9J27_05950 [Bacteroidales bacterium]|nr:hypothetical protein [Bacteroidales bacterium]MCF8333566.1 hypothetical protein [Bacteroidales bacterium]
MGTKFMKFVNENKWFVVFFLIWSFIHILLFINGENSDGFWPFDGFDRDHDYGSVEFFVYETIPLLIFVIIKLVGQDIKQKIDENN